MENDPRLLRAEHNAAQRAQWRLGFNVLLLGVAIGYLAMRWLHG